MRADGYFFCKDCGKRVHYWSNKPEVELCQDCLDELEVPSGYNPNK